MFLMSEEKKTKQTTVRYYEEDLDKITVLAKELNVSTAEIVQEWRKSYERLRLEETNSQGENLKTLRSYTDKIINLFTSMAESTQENVLNEQNKAIEAERRYEDQILKTNTLKEALEGTIKEQKKEIEKLSKELEKYHTFEETVEGRIKDKDQIIQSKNENIVALTEELKELREANKAVKEFKSKEILLKNEIEKSKDNLKQKDLDTQMKLLSLREELQDKYESRIEKIYDVENEKREKARQDLENRLREDHRKEIEHIRERNQEEIQRVRGEYEKTIEDIESKYSNQITGFQRKLENSTSKSENDTNKKA